MQQIQFVREGMNSYMTIKSQMELNPELYRDTVLEFAKIPHFMNYEIREVDGEQVLYYQFIYRTVLKQVLGDVTYTPDIIKNMIASIVHGLQQAEYYLLNQDYIVWRSDCTFIEMETGKLVFTYLPGKNSETDTLQAFLMELIQYVGKENSDSYLYAMGFYNLVTNPDCSLEELVQYQKEYENRKKEREWLDSIDSEEDIYEQKEGIRKEGLSQAKAKKEGIRKEGLSQARAQKEGIRKEGLYQARTQKEGKQKEEMYQAKSWNAGLWKEEVQQEEADNNRKNSAGKYAVLVLTVVNLLVIFCLLFEIWTYQYIWVLIVTIFLLLIALIICFHKGGEENPDEIMEEYFKAQNKEWEGSEFSNKNKEEVCFFKCKKREEEKRAEFRSNRKDEGSYVQNKDDFWENYRIEMQKEPDELKLDEFEQTVLFVDKKKQIVVEDAPKEFYLKAMDEQKYPDLLIDKKSIIIGSMQKKCDYLLQEKEISRMHAKIMKKGDGIYLLDLNSTNGTFLNNQLLESGKEYLLQEGATIVFGCVAEFEVKKK